MPPDPALRNDEVATLRAAAAWRVELAEAGVETSPAFETWLAADARNPVAWRRVQAPWATLGEHADSPDLVRHRRAALRRETPSTSAWRGRPAWRIAASVLVVLLGAALVVATMKLQTQTYQTALTERRIVWLSDGTRVSLDGGSRLRVRFRARARDLELIRGQARFDVAHDRSRPFRVHARDQTVVALGTSFTVDLLGPRVSVTLMQGRVTVTADRPGDGGTSSIAPTELRPGQRLVASLARTTPPRVESVAIDRATSWEAGKLVFEDEPLSSVVERVSRYSARPIAVADPAAGALRISGVFNAGDVTTFLDTITQYLPVDAAPGVRGGVELRSRTKKSD